MTPVVSRRSLLGGAAGALLVAGGCARSPFRALPSAQAAPVTLTVLDDTLHSVAGPLQAAWVRAHPKIGLTIGPTYGGIGPRQAVDAPGMQNAGDFGRAKDPAQGEVRRYLGREPLPKARSDRAMEVRPLASD